MDDSELEFQKIYDDFQPKILRYLVRLVGEHEAEDLISLMNGLEH